MNGYRTRQSEPIGSKVDRATPFKNAILDGRIHIAVNDNNVRGELIKQLRSFPLGKHDDIIDAISYGINFLNSYGEGSKITIGTVIGGGNYGAIKRIF